MRATIALAAMAIVLAASPAWAQKWEASGLFGFTPTIQLDHQASELSDVNIRSGFTWGFQGARFFKPHWGAEALWMQQESALEVGTSAGKADLFKMRVRQLDGNVVYELGHAEARLRPFVFGGLGATFFTADSVETETKVTFNIGGGAKWQLTPEAGVRAHVRYKPTSIKDASSGSFCDPFGFCQGTLQQVEFAAGGFVRF